MSELERTYVISPRGYPLWQKDPQAEKDYFVDWTPFLAGRQILVYTVTPQAGLTKLSESLNGGVTAFWLAGGTPGKTYAVVVHVEGTGGLKEDQTLEFEIREQ